MPFLTLEFKCSGSCGHVKDSASCYINMCLHMLIMYKSISYVTTLRSPLLKVTHLVDWAYSSFSSINTTVVIS